MNLKNARYLTGLKSTSTKFDYKITDSEYFIDYTNGRNEINNVVEKMTKLANDLNTTSEDVKAMLSSYVLDDTVDLNGFVNAVNGSMNSMASEISQLIQKAMTEASTMMDKSEALDKKTTDDFSSVTKEFEGEGKSNSSNPSGTSGNYSESVATKKKATDNCDSTAGKVTTDNQKYKVVPDSEYTGEPGTLSETDYKYLVAQVAGESGNSQDDMLGVATTIMNRLEAGGNYGNSVVSVLEKGYWPWGRTCDNYVEGGKYYNTDWGQEKLAKVNQVIDDVLNGTRNLNNDVYYYTGDGTRNYFSDIV